MNIKRLLLIFFLLGLPASELLAKPTGGLRGYVSLNQDVRTRFLVPGRNFHLSQYLGVRYREDRPSLVDLLGTYKGSVGEVHFKNFEPNSLNIVLWHLMVDRFAREVAKSCTGKSGVALNSKMSATLSKICQWPAKEATNERVLMELWTQMTSYSFPLESFTEWKKHVLEKFAGKSAKKAISAMVYTALMDPYFLLQQ